MEYTNNIHSTAGKWLYSMTFQKCFLQRKVRWTTKSQNPSLELCD